MAREYITPTALPMKEAVNLWAGKTPLSQAEIDVAAKVNHDKAFAAAGITNADMLQRVHTEISRALADGVDFREFRKRLSEVWEHAGFTGRNAWRIENIFRTNIQSAYAAGRYKQMQRVSRRRPYWQYMAVQDNRVRKTHLAMHGRVFPADDKIWDTWYPPNGYMCRCKVRSLSARQIKARNLDVEKGTKVIQLPDPGFARRPYASALAAITPVETAASGRSLVKRDKDFIPAAEIPREHILTVTPGDILPQGERDEFYLDAFFKVFGFDPEEGGFIKLPKINRTIRIGKELFVQKTTGRLKITKRGRERYLKLLAKTIQTPYEIWSDVELLSDGSRRSVLKFIRLFKDKDGRIGGFAVFELDSKREWSGTTTYVPSAGAKEETMLRAIDKKRTGKLEYREGNKKPE